jgi:hypothetical protein
VPRAADHDSKGAPRPGGERLMETVLTAGKYVHWGVVSISLTNLLVILGMIVVFVLALVIPFPRHRGGRRDDEDGS